MKLFHFIVALALSACSVAPITTQPVSKNSASVKVNTFVSAPNLRPVYRSNFDIAQEFMDFSFRLESGETIQRFTRFSGPIKIALNNPISKITSSDFQKLVRRLQVEAQLPVSIAKPGETAQIFVNFITGNQLRRAVPGAACFAIPNVKNYEELRSINRRNSDRVNWALQENRRQVSVFIPSNVPAQEKRDCLHEEIAQALGPVNDLYRVHETIFNDDDMNLALTPYDMLILRITYAPELSNGMRPGDVRAALPGILSRLNPSGNGYGSSGANRTSLEWKSLIESALGQRSNGRINKINKALQLAQRNNYNDTRLGFAYFARGFLTARKQPDSAALDFDKAYNLYQQQYGSQSIQAARTALQVASYEVSQGRTERATQLIEEGIETAKRAEDAGLLMRFQTLKTVLLLTSGQIDQANELAAEARGWAVYATGSGRVVDTIINSYVRDRPS